jgi:hypothetical protein
LRDSDPTVRAAAAVVLSDYPAAITPVAVERLCRDADARVRRSAAHMIGFAQKAEHLPCIARLLRDRDDKTQAAAALSLLSFPIANSKRLLALNLGHEFRPLFVNALAKHDPAPHLASLASIVRKNPRPKHWWGGKVTWGVSWELLFFHVQNQPVRELRRGKLDFVLDALESPGAGYYSSSEPRDLYALYLQKGLHDRARRFRKIVASRVSYDIGHYFDMVDKRPDSYRRR